MAKGHSRSARPAQPGTGHSTALPSWSKTRRPRKPQRNSSPSALSEPSFQPCSWSLHQMMTLSPLAGFSSWSSAVYRGLALLVAASPCALALGTLQPCSPAIAQAARRGVLIKGGAHLENLGTLKAVAFDKTGTLTAGRPEVTDAVLLDADTEDTLVRIAASVERQSQHPLAQAVVRAAQTRGLELFPSGPLGKHHSKRGAGDG